MKKKKSLLYVESIIDETILNIDNRLELINNYITKQISSRSYHVDDLVDEAKSYSVFYEILKEISIDFPTTNKSEMTKLMSEAREFLADDEVEKFSLDELIGTECLYLIKNGQTKQTKKTHHKIQARKKK